MASEILQAGLEIGSSHIKCVIGKVSGETIRVLGASSTRCKGIQDGNVVNIAKTIEAIREVVGMSEEQAKQNINYVNLGLHGLHIQSQNHIGAIGIVSQDREIGVHDIRQVLESARGSSHYTMGTQIIHTIPQEYIVDNQRGVVDPQGMVANHLKVNVHIVTALTSAIINLRRCVEKAGFGINHLILASLAASDVILLDEERDIGCILIDFGGRLCEVSYYSSGAIRGFAAFSNASDNITGDLAYFFKTSHEEAARIKEDFGFATPAHIPKEGKVTITKIDGRTREEVPIKAVSKAINDRLEDIFERVNAQIAKFVGRPEMIASCVVTGGGAKLPGIAEFFQERTGIITRLGLVRNCIGDDEVVNDPAYTAAIGLLKYDITKEAPTLGGKSGHRRKGLIEWLRKIF
ncbi:MAG: cell division protein FtsA [Elusimicrobia bacterium]|nr:cell division protein FtsA [Elusimicrobiota bacterium]